MSVDGPLPPPRPACEFCGRRHDLTMVALPFGLGRRAPFTACVAAAERGARREDDPMRQRIELDFHHEITDPSIERDAEGRLRLALAHRGDALIVHLSLASLEALCLALMTSLPKLKRS